MSYGYGDRGTGGGSRVNLPRPNLPPPTLISSAPTLPDNRTFSQWLTERVEGWFGSLDAFSEKVVHGTRFVIVDCIGYPYTVFCRQCQVYPYNMATPSISAPLSTAVVLHHIAQAQGIQSWWRGWYSHLALLVARPFSEAVLGRFTTPPRSLSDLKNIKPLLGYLALKGLAFVTTIPLVSFTLLEMVQNTTRKVYSGGLLEVITDRPLLYVDKNSRLPYLHLVGPTILHGFTVELVSQITRKLVHKCLPHRTDRDVLSVTVRSLWTAYFGSFLADVILFPLETIVVRLYCQGMPVLVDNIQTGLDIAFIRTYYRGLVDCIGGIWESEGVWGFYKGFSALLLRYALHGALLLVLWRIAHSLKSRTNR